MQVLLSVFNVTVYGFACYMIRVYNNITIAYTHCFTVFMCMCCFTISEITHMLDMHALYNLHNDLHVGCGLCLLHS